MNIYWLCLAIFLIGYILNMFYITVLYHRGLAHGAVILSPWLRKFTIYSGSWVTGIDPKAWVCMHRLHHKYSDTSHDPHSPWNHSLFGVMLGQLRSYERVLRGLKRSTQEFNSVISDLDFPVNWLNRKRIWWLPYFAHGAMGIFIGFVFHNYFIAVAYWLGIMSHPFQGWMVNALAHKYGYQNFKTDDQSRNNPIVALLVMGEGYQNNHHKNPSSANFAVRWFEFDMGFLFCLFAAKINFLRIAENHTKAPGIAYRSSQ